jgi:hypothetical protein
METLGIEFGSDPTIDWVRMQNVLDAYEGRRVDWDTSSDDVPDFIPDESSDDDSVTSAPWRARRSRVVRHRTQSVGTRHSISSLDSDSPARPLEWFPYLDNDPENDYYEEWTFDGLIYVRFIEEGEEVVEIRQRHYYTTQIPDGYEFELDVEPWDHLSFLAPSVLVGSEVASVDSEQDVDDFFDADGEVVGDVLNCLFDESIRRTDVSDIPPRPTRPPPIPVAHSLSVLGHALSSRVSSPSESVASVSARRDEILTEDALLGDTRMMPLSPDFAELHVHPYCQKCCPARCYFKEKGEYSMFALMPTCCPECAPQSERHYAEGGCLGPRGYPASFVELRVDAELARRLLVYKGLSDVVSRRDVNSQLFNLSDDRDFWLSDDGEHYAFYACYWRQLCALSGRAPLVGWLDSFPRCQYWLGLDEPLRASGDPNQPFTRRAGTHFTRRIVSDDASGSASSVAAAPAPAVRDFGSGQAIRPASVPRPPLPVVLPPPPPPPLPPRVSLPEQASEVVVEDASDISAVVSVPLVRLDAEIESDDPVIDEDELLRIDKDEHIKMVDEIEQYLDDNDGILPLIYHSHFTPHNLLNLGVDEDVMLMAMEHDKDIALQQVPMGFDFVKNYEPSPKLKDASTYFSPVGSNYHRTGPVVGMPVVFGKNSMVNALAGVEARSFPDNFVDMTSPEYAAYKRTWEDFIENVVTPEAVKDIVDAIPNWDFNATGKFSQEEIDNARDAWLIHVAGDASQRKSAVKDEMIAKGKKPPRQIQDEGINLFTVNQVLGHIIQELVFGEGTLGEDISIKHRPKDVILDSIVERLSNLADEIHANPAVSGGKAKLFEIDQTGMELHTRCYWDPDANGGEGDWLGTFGFAFKMMEKILDILDGHPGDFPLMKGVRINIEKLKEGVFFKIRFRDCPPIRVRFEDVYLLSGNLFTSVLNFLNELFLVLTAFTLNPWKIAGRDCSSLNPVRFKPTNRNWRSMSARRRAEIFLLAPTYVPDGYPTQADALQIAQVKARCPVFWTNAKNFDFRYLSRWLANDEGPLEVSLLNFTEGDDVLGCSDDVSSFQGQIEQSFASLGMTTKLKFIYDGRAEFVGCHMVTLRGAPTGVWCPDIRRTLLKIGFTSAPPDQLAERAFARYSSLALMFMGREPFMFNLLSSLARYWSRSVGSDVILTNYYDNPGLVGIADYVGNSQGILKINKNKLVEALWGPEPVLPATEAHEAFCLSLGVRISLSDYHRMLSVATGVVADSHGGDLLRSLPAPMVRLLKL